VIAVGVAGHEHIDVRDALVMQIRNDHQFARRASAAKRRAGIEQEHMSPRAHDHRQALPDIERCQCEGTHRGPGGVGSHERN
jgi:hypothetical protein